MFTLTSVLEGCLKNTKGALGVAVVDLHTGLLIEVAHNIPYFTETYLDAVAAAAVDMFRGKAVTAVEKALTGLRGTRVKDMIQEAQISTEATHHFMATFPTKPNLLAILITGRQMDLNSGWTTVRAVLRDAAPHCP